MHDLPTHGQAHEYDIERKDYLRHRQPAFTPEGDVYLAKLAAMPLARAAAELAPLFRLAAPEDIAGERPEYEPTSRCKSLRRQKLHFVEGFTSVKEAHAEVFRQLTMLAERRRASARRGI
jgi:hypothetical protein